MKILIAIPTDRNIDTETFKSIYNLTKPLDATIGLHFEHSYCVDISRIRIARYALEKGYDYILWIDSDMIVPKNALISLLSRDVDIIEGVISYKDINCIHAVAKRFKDGNKNEYEDILIEDILNSKNEIIEVDGVGFGVTLTKTEIFKNIKYPYFVFTEAVGEDIDFCRKAQNAGYKLYVDNQVLCGHIGKINFEIRK